MRQLLLILTFIATGTVAFAQTKITGKVTDSKTGAPLAGVSVIDRATDKGTATDIEGRYTITVTTPGKTSLVFSYNGVTQQVDEVITTANQITYQNLALEQRTKTEEAVVIRSTSTARKETAASLIAFQKNTNTVAQVISAESIRRSPDKNTGEVLRRVPGASVQDGKYLVIRGLADRYNATMINGVLMSSTEPDRKTFSFDIIPSGLIDNIIINKAFVPEYPAEWAGGMVQVNTKDVPTKNFFNVQVGTGFNTQTIGKDFYEYQGGKTDWLGYDDGTRGLPSGLPRRGIFTALSTAEKTAYASSFENVWSAEKTNGGLSTINQSLQLSGGFAKKLGANNKLAAILALTYNRNKRILNFDNQISTFQNNTPDLSFLYDSKKYSQDILAGAIANFTLQLGKDNKIAIKNILNVNTTDYTTLRTGSEFERFPTGAAIRATELAFKANTFFNTQISGDHNINAINTKFHWYGSFNILDQYIPDQRRLQYVQDTTGAFLADIGSSNSSQKSGSRYYGMLNDYVYTAGGDLSKTLKIGGRDQTVKGGYFFQVKDRLFDSRPFAIYLPQENRTLLALSPENIFSPENFGDGTGNKFAFNELPSNRYRYLANSILNAGFIQFDNQFTEKLRVVYGLRVEDFDQLVGSVKPSDDRFVNTKVTDYLPGVNATYKVNNKTNVRLSGSQTVIRPEFRELSTFSFFDFDLGSTVSGNTGLLRTKVSNFDLRYELYPRAGELFTIGAFYKYFNNPIETFFNPGTGGGTYNYLNADEATSFGAEVEVRKKLDQNAALKNFTVQANVSYIYNRVTGVGGGNTGSENRPMQGQSPYLINASVQYDLEKYGLATTLLFNQIGRRIAYVGGQDGEAPNIWENPRPVLDLQVAKSVLGKKGEIKLNVSDIINKKAIFYYDLNNNKKYDAAADNYAIRRNYGANVSISFGYNF